jgi:hypothetical protein
MIMTAFVFLPLVRSIRRLLLFPACIMRFIGAEPGETMARTLSIAKILPKPT